MKQQKQFGENVRNARSKLGWSQEELADRAGLHRTYVSGVERGVRNPTLSIILKIADALSVSVNTLFCDAADESKQRR